MLPSIKNICECKPPFLLKHSTGDWSVIIKILDNDKELRFITLYTDNNEYLQSNFTTSEKPFYVGADIWELNFGSVIMTLSHPTLTKHPATKLWHDWVSEKKEIEPYP